MTKNDNMKQHNETKTIKNQMNMKKIDYRVKNFRVFDDKGISIQLAPVTILTGRNSSGKSSIAKSFTLLNSFLEQIKYDKDKGREIHLADYKLDFTSYPNSLLGGMDKVLHRGSKSKDITMEYSIHSNLLSMDLKVSLSFGIDANDTLRNGYLQALDVKTMDGRVIYDSGKSGNSYYNLGPVREAFDSFLEAAHAFNCLGNDYCSYEFGGFRDFKSINKDEYKARQKNNFSILKKIGKERSLDVLAYIKNPYSRDILGKWWDEQVVEWVVKNGSLFEIPVVEYLAGIPRQQVIEEVEKILARGCSEGERYAINRVIDDFLETSPEEFGSFADYFHSFESEFLNEFYVMHPIASRQGTHGLYVPKAGDFVLDNSYLLYSPLDGCESVSLDWDETSINPKSETRDERKRRQEDEREEWKHQDLSFDDIYTIVMTLNNYYDRSENDSYSKLSFPDNYHHHIYDIFSEFAVSLIDEVLLPEWSGDITYVSTSRVEMERLYRLDTRSDFSLILSRYLEARRYYADNKPYEKDYEADTFLNGWVQKLGIGHSVTVDRDAEGYGVYVHLHKTAGDKGEVLADEGYGITQLVSILLTVETAIMSNKGNCQGSYPGLQMFDTQDSAKFHYAWQTLVVEEPEIHLHPQYQSLLADMFVEAAQYNIHFIVETHSEYLIRKTQVFVAQTGYKDDDELEKNNPFAVYYLPENKRPYAMVYRTDGKFANEFGSGFFDEAVNLAFKLF